MPLSADMPAPVKTASRLAAASISVMASSGAVFGTPVMDVILIVIEC
jgi:hypothetical protein